MCACTWYSEDCLKEECSNGKGCAVVKHDVKSGERKSHILQCAPDFNQTKYRQKTKQISLLFLKQQSAFSNAAVRNTARHVALVIERSAACHTPRVIQ